jgi:hypothetical protein
MNRCSHLSAGLLVLALSGWASGCRAQHDNEAASERQAIAVELLVAPVIDDHPWVIALLTEISITRPPGADARLEGRNGPEGLRHPEPIIEGTSREALAQALAAYEAKHPRSPELWPVWEFEPFGPGERVTWRLHFVDRSRGFVADDQARASIVRHDHGPSVHVSLGEAQRKTFYALTLEAVGGRLAIAVDGDVVMLPIVMEPIVDGELQLLTRTREDPEVTAPALLARLRGQ